jgi:hypothetical protein
MKKISFILIAAMLIFMSFGAKTHAAGGAGSGHITIAPSSSSAIADGSSAVTISIYVYVINYHCQDGTVVYNVSDCVSYGGGGTPFNDKVAPETPSISVSGSGNTVSPTSVTTDASGNASFTLKSTVAETKTVTVTSTNVLLPFSGTTSIAFTAPVVTQKPKTTVSPAAPTTTTPVPPANPTVSSITIAGQNENLPASGADTASVTFSQNQPLVLSGTTVPNGVVTLTIHSTPMTVTTTADGSGKWSYTVTGLAAGSHYVEASVMDPATKLSSPTAKLLSFTVKPVVAAATVTAPKKSSSKLPMVLGVIILLALAGGGYWWWKKKNSIKLADSINLPPSS